MTTKEISQKISEYKAKGCTLPDDQIIKIITRENKPSNHSKKGFERRANMNPDAVNTLWGPDCKYSTQAEYQRSCLGDKWN